MSERKNVNDVFDNSENNPLDIALAKSLNLILEKFESKNIIPKNLAKSYAIVGNTNKVQKDLIDSIIAKQNDSKGQVKKMYMKIIFKITEAIKTNKEEKSEKESKFGNILRRF